MEVLSENIYFERWRVEEKLRVDDGEKRMKRRIEMENNGNEKWK